MKVHPQLSHEEAGSPAYESAPPEDIKIHPQESEEPLDESPTYLPWAREPEIPPRDEPPLRKEEAVEEIEAEDIEPEEQMKETPPEIKEEGPAYPLSEY